MERLKIGPDAPHGEQIDSPHDSSLRGAETFSLAPEGEYDTLCRELAKLNDFQRVAVGALLAAEPAITIGNGRMFESRLASLCNKNKAEVAVSKNVAKKILGYRMKVDVISGQKTNVYYSVDSPKSPVFYIPQVGSDTFSGLLVRLCIRIAERLGVQDGLIPGFDIATYHAVAAKGGPYRSIAFVSPDEQGVIPIRPRGPGSASLAVYNLDGAIGVRFASGVEVAFPERGDLEDFFSDYLYVSPEGAVNIGHEIHVSGREHPTSFLGGYPDSSDETLAAVEWLIQVNENDFRERYEACLGASSPSATKSLAVTGGFQFYDSVLVAEVKWVRRNPDFRVALCDEIAQIVGGESPTGEVEFERWRGLAYNVLRSDIERAVVEYFVRGGAGTLTCCVGNDIFPTCHEVVAAHIGKTNMRKLFAFIKTKKRDSAPTLESAAREAQASGLLPVLTFSCFGTEFVTSPTLVFVMALAKWRNIIKIHAVAGRHAFYVDNIFYVKH